MDHQMNDVAGRDQLKDSQKELEALLSQALQSKSAVEDMQKNLERQQASKQAQLEAIVAHQNQLLSKVQDGLATAEALTRKNITQQKQLDEVARQQQHTAAMIEKERTYQRQVLGFPCVPLRVGGQQIEVGIDTLLLNTPEGSYFRGLLRQYAVDGETDAREYLEDAIRRNGGSLPLDEDPDTIKTLINYLRYANNPTMAGKDPKALLLPSTEPQLSMLIAAAERLGLDSSLGCLAPRSDIVAHLTTCDAEVRAQEEKYREAFVSTPQAMVEAWKRGELLLDVFNPDVLPTFVYEGGSSSYPQLFTHLQFPTADLPAGARSVVGSLEKFKEQFHFFTGGLFQYADWSNMIVAGGAVMACLLRPPEAVEQLSENRTDRITYLDGLRKWLGPNTRVRHHWRFNEELQLATSGFGDSDIDIFFYGLTPAAASAKLKKLIKQLHSSGKEGVSIAVRSEHAVTLVIEAENNGTNKSATHVQVVLRLYSCPAEVLMGFDIDSCCVAFDGSRVYAIPRSRRAVNRRQNVVDPGRLSPSYESRLAKYARRGFKVAVPGFPGRSRINSTIYLKTFAELKGLARLLRLEQRSIRSRIQMGDSLHCTIRPKQATYTSKKGRADMHHWGIGVLETAKADSDAAAVEKWAAWQESQAADSTLYRNLNKGDYSSLHIPKHLRVSDVSYYLSFKANKLKNAGLPTHTVWQEYNENPVVARVTVATEATTAAAEQAVAAATVAGGADGLLARNIAFMTRLISGDGGPAAVATLAATVATINPAAGLVQLAAFAEPTANNANLAAAAAIGAAAAAIGIDMQQLHAHLSLRPLPVLPTVQQVQAARVAATSQTSQEDYIFDASPLLLKFPGLVLGIPAKLEWMVDNPGRQGKLTGSFQPIEDDWTQQAYEIVPDEL